MSLTINGTTNTLTAASGLAIAGNTAVTGTLSATTFTQSGDLSAINLQSLTNSVASYANTNNFVRFINSGGNPVGGLTHPAVTTLGLWGNAGVKVVTGSSGATTVADFSSTGLAVTGALSATNTQGNNHLTLTNSTDGLITQIENNSSGQTLYTNRNQPWKCYVNNAIVTSTSSTGLAVTGTLSASGTVTASTGLVWGTSTYQGYLSYSAGNVFIGNLSTGLVNFAVNSVTVAAMSSTAFEAVKPFLVSDTTDATSTTAASLKTAGGLAVAKKGYFGDNIVMASGKGIDFSLAAGDAVGTAANVLDAYEEGTWTPVIGGLTTTSGQTYSTQSGRYTKVGNKVTLTAEMILTAKGTITGFSTIVGGFPFAVLDSPSAAVRFTGLGVNWISVILMPRATFTNAYLCGTKAAAAGVSLFADNGGDITDTTNIAFSFTYFTS
jgi:hypothetical protein